MSTPNVISAWMIAAACCWTPSQALAAVATDLERLPAERRAQSRYLWLVEPTPAERQASAAAVSYLLNAVSRTRVITRPSPVDEHLRLLRVDLAAYSDLRRPAGYQELFTAWERLVRDDPYFHIRTQIVTAGKTTTVTTDGGWAGLATAEQVRKLSTSTGAVLRADYFVAQVGGQAYYEWAGIPEQERDFFRQFGVDARLINELSADTAANLHRSNVTNKPRRIIARPGAFGHLWQTKDIDAEAPDRDPFRNPLDFREQRFQFQASEYFVLGANRLWRVALYDAAGKRQDSVPDQIAKDIAGDGIVAPLVSCLRCHERNGGSAGLQPFVDQQTALMSQAGLASYLPEIVQRLVELYDPQRLSIAIERDRADYTTAVTAATGGLTPAAVTDALVAMYAGYLDRPVTPARAAQELGVEPTALREALAESRDTITLAIVAGQTVNRAAWASAYGDAALFVEQFFQRGKP